MPSTDIDGTPLLILGLPDVKILYHMLDTPETPDQDAVMKKIITFINDPQCIKWEEDHNA